MMPTRNRASMLPTALRSLLWQTCGDFECIVMDDGSKDETPDVFKRFSGDPRFIWHRFKALGVSVCRNIALKQARGRFITFLDDDDIWLPDRLETFRDAARERPDVAFWFSNAYVWRYDRIIGRMFDPHRIIPEGRLSGYYAIGDRYLPYVTTNLSIAREAFDKVGAFHEGIPILSDTLPRPLAVRRLHDAQVTKDHAKAFEESAVVLKNARITVEMKESLRRDLALEIGGYLVKNLEGAKMQEFLRRTGIERDAGYWRLYATGFLPRCVLSLLYRARKLYLELRYRPRFAGKEFRAIDALVRPLL